MIWTLDVVLSQIALFRTSSWYSCCCLKTSVEICQEDSLERAVYIIYSAVLLSNTWFTTRLFVYCIYLFVQTSFSTMHFFVSTYVYKIPLISPTQLCCWSYCWNWNNGTERTRDLDYCQLWVTCSATLRQTGSNLKGDAGIAECWTLNCWYHT